MKRDSEETGPRGSGKQDQEASHSCWLVSRELAASLTAVSYSSFKGLVASFYLCFTFYFEIISNMHESCKKSTLAYISFIQIYQQTLATITFSSFVFSKHILFFSEAFESKFGTLWPFTVNLNPVGWIPKNKYILLHNHRTIIIIKYYSNYKTWKFSNYLLLPNLQTLLKFYQLF